jgi:peroxiredoxin Q/BCP
MAIAVGERAPSFSAKNLDGAPISLDDYAGRRVVLYFFRRIFTPLCAAETKGFRDNQPELREHGVEVIGVSADTPQTHCRFGSKHSISFPLICDEGRAISRAYGVLWPWFGGIGRYTFILDEQHVVAAVMHHEFQANRHLDDVLRFVRAWSDRTSDGLGLGLVKEGVKKA